MFLKHTSHKPIHTTLHTYDWEKVYCVHSFAFRNVSHYFDKIIIIILCHNESARETEGIMIPKLTEEMKLL